MNNKGLFCIALVIAIAGIELEILHAETTANAALAEAKAVAIEAEQLNAARTAIEDNADALVEQELHTQLLLDRQPEEIKQAVNSKLAGFFAATESAYGGAIKIKFLASGGTAADARFLNENSSLAVIPLGGRAAAGEYTFTGGMLHGKEVLAEISGSRAGQRFRLPAGYTIRATVAK